MYELTEIHNGEVNLHSILAQNEAICAAVEKSRDYIMITNRNHMIQVISRVFNYFYTREYHFILVFSFTGCIRICMAEVFVQFNYSVEWYRNENQYCEMNVYIYLKSDIEFFFFTKVNLAE